MPQARAGETRRRILDSAIELFTTVGYAQTSLNDIVAHSHLTTGAFYYHFNSKDAVAATIVEEGWPRIVALADEHLGAASPGLKNIIGLSFAVTVEMAADRSLWLSYDLDYRIGAPPLAVGPGFAQHHAMLTERFAAVLRSAALQDGVHPEQAAATIVAVHYGLLSTALHGSSPAAGPETVVRQLVVMWPVLLRGIVAPASLPQFLEFLDRTASRYQRLDA